MLPHRVWAEKSEAKNLDPQVDMKTTAGEKTTSQRDLKGKLVEFAFWMQKQGYKESTINTRIIRLETLAKRGADLLNPESVKQVLALQKTWSDGTKANVIDAYTCFLQKEGLTWNPPKYVRLETIPFIPSEAELNQLIGACGKVLGTFLQGLKETGADPGELAAITSRDVNKQSRTITLNHPVKGHRPRIVPVSPELIRRLEDIADASQRIFNDFILRRAFYYKRKATAHKLLNPRLLEITFITFRHWFGTMEYHRTKDILHVQRLLGHKNIQNTLIYIDLESKLFNSPSEGFTSRIAQNAGEACSLIEAGFEYVTGEYSDGGKLFRKRL
jgi:integrase